MQLHMLLFLIECQSVIVPILFKLPSCCCHQATDLHTMGFVAFFCSATAFSAAANQQQFFVSLSTSSIILYMKEKKIIISECISATDRNNEFQLRVLLRDEMLLRSVFSAKDLIFFMMFENQQKCLF